MLFAFFAHRSEREACTLILWSLQGLWIFHVNRLHLADLGIALISLTCFIYLFAWTHSSHLFYLFICSDSFLSPVLFIYLFICSDSFLSPVLFIYLLWLISITCFIYLFIYLDSFQSPVLFIYFLRLISLNCLFIYLLWLISLNCLFIYLLWLISLTCFIYLFARTHFSHLFYLIFI